MAEQTETQRRARLVHERLTMDADFDNGPSCSEIDEMEIDAIIEAQEAEARGENA